MITEMMSETPYPGLDLLGRRARLWLNNDRPKVLRRSARRSWIRAYHKHLARYLLIVLRTPDC